MYDWVRWGSGMVLAGLAGAGLALLGVGDAIRVGSMSLLVSYRVVWLCRGGGNMGVGSSGSRVWSGSAWVAKIGCAV